MNSTVLYALSVMIAAGWLSFSTTVRSDSKSDFESACTACHGFGISGAPRHGDRISWAPRIAQGLEILYDHAINGFTGETGVMPPKGGFTDLSDDQVRAIVDYMVDEGQ